MRHLNPPRMYAPPMARPMFMESDGILDQLKALWQRFWTWLMGIFSGGSDDTEKKTSR